MLPFETSGTFGIVVNLITARAKIEHFFVILAGAVNSHRMSGVNANGITFSDFEIGNPVIAEGGLTVILARERERELELELTSAAALALELRLRRSEGSWVSGQEEQSRPLQTR